MAARKLQAEVERTFKKVQEGITAFEDIQFKLDTSSNPSQKEKLESDLKKEIKRLQRLRDQIKSWATSNDIKDKKALLEYRKLIEMKMEEFKAVEKEIKTKAFSKEGLIAGTKADMRGKEKAEVPSWVSNMVDELDNQIEQLEAKAESIRVFLRKKPKDQTKKDRLSEIEYFIDKHKWHQDNLEQIIRKIENETLSISQVIDIKDDVIYYVESNQNPDFAEDEILYDDLNLFDDSKANEKAEEKVVEDFKQLGVEDDSLPAKESEASVANQVDTIKTPKAAVKPDISISTPEKLKETSQQAITAKKSSSSIKAMQPNFERKVSEAEDEEKSAIDQSKLGPLFKDIVSSYERVKEKARIGFSLEELNVALEDSFKNVVEASDCENPDRYQPKNYKFTPYYYPQHPLKILQTPSIVSKMELDTLFFMFYYQAETYAQSLAARELKKQCWRFHKKYLTWFQRHEEPTQFTEEYESGTYRYFDYQGAWVQRKKADFKFLYSYLEDDE